MKEVGIGLGYGPAFPYKLDPKDCSRLFADGMVFNALLHGYDNDCMDYSALDSKNAKENCKNAFEKAAAMGITQLLEVEDVADTVPDEKSVMMQVSLYYKHFHSNQGMKLKAKRRILCSCN